MNGTSGWVRPVLTIAGGIIAAALILGLVVVVLVASAAGTYVWLNGKLNKNVTLPATSLTSAGTNWLITGSYSRAGLSRAEIDASPERIQAKVRAASLAKIPYKLIVGQQEAQARTVAVRTGADEGAKPLSEVVQRLKNQVAERNQ